MRRLALYLAVGFSLSSFFSASVLAVTLEYDDLSIGIDTTFTAGAMWRTQEPDRDFIGKTNLAGQEDLCAPSATDPLGVCVVSGHADYLAAPGAHSTNNDNGNLNFDKGELVHGTFKLPVIFRSAGAILVRSLVSMVSMTMCMMAAVSDTLIQPMNQH